MFSARGDLGSNLEQLGLSELQGSLTDDGCEVWMCNWPTVMLFMSMQTQWRSGMNGITGLDYCALGVVAKGIGLKLSRKRIEGVMHMEREALKLMDEKREASHGK